MFKRDLWLLFQKPFAIFEQVATFWLACLHSPWCQIGSFVKFRIVKFYSYISPIRQILTWVKQAWCLHQLHVIFTSSIKTFAILFIKQCHRWIWVLKIQYCGLNLSIFQIWFSKDNTLTKWPFFHEQQVSSVLPEVSDYNFVKIYNV